MEAMKDTLSSWLKYFKDYINSFSFVEKEKNIFYFSKFSLDISEFFSIHEFIKKLKENIFKENLEQLKYCVKNIIIFNEEDNNNKNLIEKEKIIILFSACLFIYYKKFRYNTNCSFDNYFDNDFILIAKNIFKFEIKNNEIFKIFAFYFFSIIQKQIQSLDYTKIKNLKKYYNFSVLEKKEEKEEENIYMINGSSQKVNAGFQDQVLTFLISAKEKMLELVFTTEKNQSNINDLFSEEIKDMNSRFQKLNNNSNFYIDNNDKKIQEKNNISQMNDSNSDVKSDNKSDMIIDDFTNIKNNNNSMNNNSLNLEDNNNNINFLGNDTHSNKFSLTKTDFSINKNTNIQQIKNSIVGNDNTMNLNKNNLDLNLSNSNISSLEKSFDSKNNFSTNCNINQSQKESLNIYSKKIVRELIKSEFDKETRDIIEHVSKIIDEKYLDSSLNTTQKTVCLIQYYCCYIVEFTPDMLQNMCPEYKDNLKNFDIRFIVLAKELYNTTMEIFSTIYDLSYTNFDTFIELTKDCGIQLEHAKGLCTIFKEYSIMLLNEKKKKKNINSNCNKYTLNVLRKLFDNEYQKWTNIIKQKSNEFTNYCKI